MQHIIRAHTSLKHFTEARLLISKLNKDDKMKILLTAQIFHKEEKYTEALEILEKEVYDNSEWWLEIGLIYWDCGLYEKCLMPFLKVLF